MRRLMLKYGYEILLDNSDYRRLGHKTWYYNGRYVVRGGKKTIHIAREILGLRKSNVYVDHINHNVLDNRRINLRKCNNRQNQWNQKVRQGYSSKYKGVCWHSRDKIWQAQIRYKGGRQYLGQFHNEKEAARVYDKAAKRLHGEFACLNFNM